MFSLINLTRHFQFNEGQTSGYSSKNKNGGQDHAVEPEMGGELTCWNFYRTRVRSLFILVTD